MDILNFIPFWIHISGIPFQFKNREVILHIARAMGQYIQMVYNEEMGGKLEFIKVRLNWDVNQSLQFQCHFQFAASVNILLRFHYEMPEGIL